jgi:hypothetical protein
VTALPARHFFGGRSLFDRFEILWDSFALAGPQHRVYYGADSGEWAGFREIGEDQFARDKAFANAVRKLQADVEAKHAAAELQKEGDQAAVDT